MLCTNCQEERVENETSCPHCGAPSPLLQLSGIGQWGTNSSGGAWPTAGFGLSNNLQMNSWGGPATYEARPQATESQWEQASMDRSVQQQSPSFQQPMGLEQAWDASVPQLGFDQGALTSSSPLNAGWPQMSPSSQNMLAWQDNGVERKAPSQALLPVVYQEPQANDMRQSTVALQLVPQQAIEHLLPEMAEVPEGVYVPPHFINPRPLIPRYRIISGTLSVLIVTLLLCSGVGYYAQASGILGNVVRMFTGAPPSTSITSTTPHLANPTDTVDEGPATGIISSGTTTLRINQSNLAVETDKVFTVNQTFYVTYTVQPPQGQDGKVSVKWYMNGQFYRSVPSDRVINGGTMWNGSVPMQYALPAEGSVEVYWNDQLGKRFYFVVQPIH